MTAALKNLPPPASVDLPLSWSQSSSERLSALELPSGAKFVYSARVSPDTSASELTRTLESLGTFIVHDCDESLAETLGGTRLQLSSAARIDLSGYVAPKSVRDLARRGAKHAVLCELKITRSNAARLEPWLDSLRDPGAPKLRYLFRTEFRDADRAFAAFAPNSLQPWALVTLSRYGDGAWHVGLLCRDRAAKVGTMEALLIHIIDTLQREGARALNLGGVPLDFTGEADDLSVGNRLLKLLARPLRRIGRRRYDAEGLHRFKAKFAPVWEPRFFVSNAPLKLADARAIARLSGVSGRAS